MRGRWEVKGVIYCKMTVLFVIRDTFIENGTASLLILDSVRPLMCGRGVVSSRMWVASGGKIEWVGGKERGGYEVREGIMFRLVSVEILLFKEIFDGGMERGRGKDIER